EHGAMMLETPLTAWALVDEARKGGHRAAVQTAAASALGKMMVRLAKRFSLPLINVVRRPEQVELLRQSGAEHVLDSSAAGFDEQLHSLCHKLGATIGFDAVSGELSARVLRAQPLGARLLVYGALSLEACQTDPASLIFEGKRLEGFWLSGWLRNKNLVQKFRVSSQVQALLATDLKSEVQGRFPLQDVAQALDQYAKSMSAGKVLLKP
ncbi:MAG: zinc-binding dehydrogenase, partial [Terriglobales bacterium]